MATIEEFYNFDFGFLRMSMPLSLQNPAGNNETSIVGSIHFDDRSLTKFISYLVKTDAFTEELANALLLSTQPFILKANTARIENLLESPGLFADQRHAIAAAYAFSGRIYIYVDGQVDEKVAEAVLHNALALGLKVEIRDKRFAEHQSNLATPLAFISHDSRDKESIVRELANSLTRLKCPVWYDEFQLRAGDSLRESIDRGLKISPKCIVVLSKNFCDETGWTSAEFNAAFGKHVEKGNVIVPVWHDITKDEVAAFSPMVADIYAINTSVGLDELVRRVRLAIDPPPSDVLYRTK